MKKGGLVALNSDPVEEDDAEALVEIEESDLEEEVEESLITSSSDSDSDFDLELAAEKEGEIGSLARQARTLQDELQGDDESEDELQSEEEEGGLGWGNSKERFYGMDLSSKEDEMREDIEESLRLQKAHLATLKESDFDLPSMDKIIENQTANKTNATDVQHENQEEELLELYQNLKASLEELQLRIDPLLQEAKSGDLCTSEGLTYLEVKHSLLLHYCMCILFYILLKLEGASIEGHPVILRMVEIRTFLEKLKPMEIRLQPQVDKLLKAISLAKENESYEAEEEEEVAPRPKELIPKTTGDEEEVYRPPKINPVSMDRPSRKKKQKNQTMNDSMVGEIVREIKGAPEELPSGNAPFEKMKSLLAARKALEQSNFEEENFSRLNSSKQSKRSKDQRKQELYGGITFEDFADDIDETVNALKHLSTPHRKKDLISGDGDVPLGKTKLEKLHKAQEQVPCDDSVIEKDPDETPTKPRKKRKEVAELTMTRPPKAPALAKGKRAISHEIYKNRGLTPHRTRDKKNPRKRIRRQFENKEKKRKGQVRKAGKEAPDHYGGEGSGISARVRKSIRFG